MQKTTLSNDESIMLRDHNLKRYCSCTLTSVAIWAQGVARSTGAHIASYGVGAAVRAAAAGAAAFIVVSAEGSCCVQSKARGAGLAGCSRSDGGRCNYAQF